MMWSGEVRLRASFAEADAQVIHPSMPHQHTAPARTSLAQSADHERYVLSALQHDCEGLDVKSACWAILRVVADLAAELVPAAMWTGEEELAVDAVTEYQQFEQADPDVVSRLIERRSLTHTEPDPERCTQFQA